MSPGRPDVHPGRAPSPNSNPFAPRAPKKPSLSRATRSRPCPIQPHARPTDPHDCAISPHQSAPIPQFRQPSGNIRTSVLSSPTQGTDPAVRKALPQSAEGPGISRGSESWPPATGHRRAPCPPLSRGATLVSRQPRVCMTDWRRTAGTPSYETHRMSQNRTDFALPPSRG